MPIRLMSFFCDCYALLSEREREVLGLIVAGLTNKEIGRALTLSPRTVETHRANLFAKLEVESLVVLIRRFAGLVEAGYKATSVMPPYRHNERRKEHPAWQFSNIPSKFSPTI